MNILTLMTNNNCDILQKGQSPSPDYRVPPINLDDLPKFLLGKLCCDFVYEVKLYRRQDKFNIINNIFIIICDNGLSIILNHL